MAIFGIEKRGWFNFMGSYSGGCICLSSPWCCLLDFVELRKQLKTHYCIFFLQHLHLKISLKWEWVHDPPTLSAAPSPSANFTVLNCWLQRKRIDRRPPLWSFWCNVSCHPNYNWTPIKVLKALPVNVNVINSEILIAYYDSLYF